MVAGDVVNTAARMQAAAPVNGVLVGETTYRATQRRDRATARRRRSTAKGKAEPIAVWEAVEAVARFGVDLVERAQHAARRARAGARAAALDSRARAEGALGAARHARRRPRHRQVATRRRALPARDERERADPLAPGPLPPLRRGHHVLGARRDRQGGGGDPRDRRARARRSESSAQAVARLVPDEARGALARGASCARSSGSASDGRQSAPRPRRPPGAASSTAIAEQRPTVLVFEDLHWADDGLLDFLDDLVDWLRAVAAAGRRRRRGPSCSSAGRGWGGGKANATTISLQPLDEEDTDAADLEPARPAAAARRRAAGAARAGRRQPALRRAVRPHARRARNDGRAARVGAGRDRRPARRAAARPRRSCSRRRRCTARSSGSAAWPRRAASRRQTPRSLLRALERKDFVRAGAALDGRRRHPVRVPARPAARRRVRPDPARARAREKHRRAAEWIEGLGRARRPRRAARLPLQGGARALARGRAPRTSRSWSSGHARRCGPRASARWRCPPTRPPTGSSPTRSRSRRRRPAHGRRCCCCALGALIVIGGDGLGLLDGGDRRFRAAGDAEGWPRPRRRRPRFAWFAGDRAAPTAYRGGARGASRTARVSERGPRRSRTRAASSCSAGASRSRSASARRRYRSSRRSAWRSSARACTSWSAPPVAAWATPAGSTRSRAGHRDRGDAVGNVDMVVAGLRQPLVRAALLGQARGGAARMAARARAVRALRARPPVARRPAGGQLGLLDGRWDEALPSADQLIAAAEAGDRLHRRDGLSLRAWIRLARGDDAGADRDSRGRPSGRAPRMRRRRRPRSRSAPRSRSPWATSTRRVPARPSSQRSGRWP